MFYKIKTINIKQTILNIKNMSPYAKLFKVVIDSKLYKLIFLSEKSEVDISLPDVSYCSVKVSEVYDDD